MEVLHEKEAYQRRLEEERDRVTALQAEVRHRSKEVDEAMQETGQARQKVTEVERSAALALTTRRDAEERMSTLLRRQNQLEMEAKDARQSASEARRGATEACSEREVAQAEVEDLKRRLSNEKRQKESLEMETVTLTAELEAAKTQLSAAEQASVEVDTERRRLMSKVESLQDSAWRATREAQDDAEVLAKKVAEERQSWDEERSRLEQLLDSGQRRILASMSRMRQTEVESKFESIVARQHGLKPAEYHQTR